MSTKTLTILAVLVVCVVLIFSLIGIYISVSNQEIGLRNMFKAKQLDNKNEFDGMWKKIKQVAQVSEKDRSTLQDTFVKYAEARTGQGDNGSLMKWIQEAVPSVDNGTYKNLMNIIVSSRDSWTMRQKELLDIKRQHDDIRLKFPGSLILAGRSELKVQIVTSSKTEKAFQTGVDDSTDVF